MNSLNFKIAKTFIKLSVFTLTFFTHVSVKAWEVDLSRRQKELRSMRMPASVVDQQAPAEPATLSTFFDVNEPAQEVVILNTDKGFVPETVRLKKGGNYRIHVVNVNSGQKNTSFILDAFSQHHATFFGEQKTFSVAPKTDGVFSFQCPETAKQGKIIVVDDAGRMPASN